jgi:effector-binding domain-containing protein
MTGVPTGLYFTWDEQSGTTDMAVGIPVSGSATVPNTEMMTVAAGKALTIDYHGSYDGLQSAHLAIDEFINSTGVQTKMPVIEEYVTDPQAEPDMNKWLTKIYYLLDQ